MDNLSKISTKKGQIIPMTYEKRDFEVIVIDPNGVGEGQPSIGFSFTKMDKHGGLPSSTCSDWLARGIRNTGEKVLELPSGNTFRVSEIKDLDGNDAFVVEVSDWMAIALDVLKKPGKIKKSTKNNLLDFLGWFAVKGFYADAYAILKGAYTKKDSRAISGWLVTRLSGVPTRNEYTDFLQSQGCEGYDYAYWTDYVYQGLFGKRAWEMKQIWKLVEGNKNIGRNYIPEVTGLEAVAYCETQVIKLFYESLEQAHDDAIRFAKKKFKLDF